MYYSLSKIADLTGGKFSGADLRVTSVFTDSRSTVPDGSSIFVAIPGLSHDGHDHVGELYRRGVRAFLVERQMFTDIYPDAGFITVPDSVEALQMLAADYRKGLDATVVAITGSNGKTIVKEWLYDIVSPNEKAFRSPRSYNSQIGVPLSVLMIPVDCRIAIIEAGISRVGEMERLEKIIRPDIGVFTTLGDAHQENFESYEHKASEKLKLFVDASAIVYNSHYARAAKIIQNNFPDAVLFDAAATELPENIFEDRAAAENATIVLTACDALGIDRKLSLPALSSLKPVAMRLEMKEGYGGSIIINDYYNSDINSVAIAIDHLRRTSAGRPMTLILSDIEQSGMKEEELYGNISRMVAGADINKFIGVGPALFRNRRLFDSGSAFYSDTDDFLRSTSHSSSAGQALLLKGNSNSGFERIGRLLEKQSHTTVFEINLDAVIRNLNAHRMIVGPDTRIMAMVKAAGYGTGTVELASALQAQGIDYLAVAFTDEGTELRRGGISVPIVVLNADSDSYDSMITNRLEPEIYSMESLRQFADTAQRHGEVTYPIHIKIDTGMHRLGFASDEMGSLIRELVNYRDTLRVASVFSHLAASDEPFHDDFTRLQIKSFSQAAITISDAIGYNPLFHIANSAAIERFPEAKFDMVRLGIGLYGISAIPELNLEPVAELVTRIVQIHDVSPPDTVGYGRAGKPGDHRRIATIPVGYADGIDRRLGEGNWNVVTGEIAVPTFGRICMDTMMIDVTDAEVSEGDRVIILGPRAGNRIQDMASVLGTIPYEILTGISSRVKRVYIKE